MSLVKKFEEDIEPSRFSKKRVISLLVVLLVVVVIVEIWSANRLATYGEQINKIEQAKANLELENQILSNEVSKASSLAKLGDYATSLGFESISHIQYLQPENLALNH